MTMADTIAVMNAGAIEQLDDPDTIYRRPATAFALEFVGLSTRLAGRVVGEAGEGEVAVETRFGTVRGRGRFLPGSAVTVGVRPELIGFAATDDPEVNARVAAAAESRHTFCVRSDDARGGSAWTPAVGHHGSVTVGVLGNREPRKSAALRDDIVIALPPTSTTTVGVPVAPTRRISSSWRPGSASDARSRNSPSSMPATTTATALRRASATAESTRASRSSGGPASHTSRTRALPAPSKNSSRRSCSVHEVPSDSLARCNIRRAAE